MALVRWNPWNEMTDLQRRINRVFEDSFTRTGSLEDDYGLRSWNPAVDIFEKGDAIVIQAELPGLRKEDISIDFKDQVLTLKGERKFDREIKEEDYFRKERAVGRFQRAFSIPAAVNAEKIRADFKDGVLTIHIPKPEEAKQKQISIS